MSRSSGDKADGCTDGTNVGLQAGQASFASAVIAWQREHGRHGLPWQGSTDPYRVWLSEIMLQQTQVGTVLSYFRLFLQRFPDVQALAAASQEEVMALWSGLGYYSRARNLHACAKEVVAEHGGRFPESSALLQTLPGIGKSTAAAIAAFCFGERVAILDGNVKRVLSRYLAFSGDLAVAAQERQLWAWANSLLPQAGGIEAYTQGLMDLGATVCLPRAPLCLLCPVHSHCEARRQGEPERFPVKTRKLKRGRRSSAWLWLQWGEQMWLLQRPDQGIWAGLFSLPEFDTPADLQAFCADWPGAGEPLPAFTHVLTHLDWTLQPLRWQLPAGLSSERVASLTASWPAGRWVGQAEALRLGLPSALRKLLLRSGLAAAAEDEVVLEEAG